MSERIDQDTADELIAAHSLRPVTHVVRVTEWTDPQGNVVVETRRLAGIRGELHEAIPCVVHPDDCEWSDELATTNPDGPYVKVCQTHGEVRA